MNLQVALQMDPLDSLNLKTDSSYALATEARKRGHNLFHYLPQDLILDENQIKAGCRGLGINSKDELSYSLGSLETRQLIDFDVILLRQDPPFDMSYITTTHILEMVSKDVLVVNDPFWVRNHPEKILALGFPDLVPPTSIGRDMKLFNSFRQKHKDVILKPLFGNGGAGVFFVQKNDLNFYALCEMFLQSSREPLIIQKYLPDVRAGDKRIILVDGKPIGALNRIPAKNEARSNLHVGGRAEKVELNERDMEICERIGPLLSEHGQIFVGIDVIGKFLTEINVTSPTGLVELEEFDGINAAGMIWDAIESRVK